MHRWLPGRAFPPYAFVPGQRPHPRSDPSGHSYGYAKPPVQVLDPERWWRSDEYLWGIDLWNHGYYWEAHEAWEGLWRAEVEDGSPALAALLKGLIKLAAAGVKVRQGLPGSVRSHGERALDQFQLAKRLAQRQELCGLELDALIDLADRIAVHAEAWSGVPDLPVQVVFDQRLAPSRPQDQLDQ